MAKFKFQISRRSIMLETYWVEADTEEQALEICYDGDVPEPALEFVDWVDDQYEVDDKECIDPLYKMVKDYDPPAEYYVNESGLKIDTITGMIYAKEIG